MTKARRRALTGRDVRDGLLVGLVLAAGMIASAIGFVLALGLVGFGVTSLVQDGVGFWALACLGGGAVIGYLTVRYGITVPFWP